jgi:hypothetical protein
LEVSQLWLQDRISRKEFDVIKIGGKINRADALTKYVGRGDLENLCRWLGLVSERGRHELMPEDAAKPGEDEEGIFRESEEEKEDDAQDEAMVSGSRSGAVETDVLDIEELTWHKVSNRREEEICRTIDAQEDAAGLNADVGHIGLVRFSLAANRGSNPKEQGMTTGFTHVTRLEDNSTLLDHTRILALRLNCREDDIVLTTREVPGKLSSAGKGKENAGRILVPGSNGEHGAYQEVSFYLLSGSQVEDGEHDKDAVTSEDEKPTMMELRVLPAWRTSQRQIRNLRRFNRCQALHQGLAFECKGAVDRIKHKINKGRAERSSQLKEFVNKKVIDGRLGSEGGIPIGKFGKNGKRTSLRTRAEEIETQSPTDAPSPEEENAAGSSKPRRNDKSRKRALRDSSMSRRKRPLLEVTVNGDAMPESYVDQFQARGSHLFKGRRAPVQAGRDSDGGRTRLQRRGPNRS